MEIPQGFNEVVVRDFTGLDGCNFLLVQSDSSRLEAANLPDSLKKDGLIIWVRTAPENGVMSICMGGKPVRILEARFRER